VPAEGPYEKLDRFGWHTMTEEEQQFIASLVDTLLPEYRNYAAVNQLSASDPFVLKLAIENPKDPKDTIMIYLIRKTRWQP
jgi:hypothetical protein